MARSGTKRAVGRPNSPAAEETRGALIEGAIGALREEGFSGASAREIARRAGCNQGLVFYHFDSVTGLLLAALDAVSERRRERYQAAVDTTEGLDALVDTAAMVFEEDLDLGYIAVLAEMIAGASSTPGLGPEVAARIAPWRQFTAEALRDALAETPFGQLIPPEEMAHGIVALYLGLEMLAHLDGDRAPAMVLFDQARKLVGLAQAFSGLQMTKEATT